jgi:hypothetical protein
MQTRVGKNRDKKDSADKKTACAGGKQTVLPLV